MITVTVSDIVHGNWDKLDPTDEPFCIYVIREDETVFYVGRSDDPFTRLYNHFTKYSGAAIGPFYQDFEMEANKWKIDLCTLEDCQDLTNISTENIAKAEIAMIQHYRTCLNVLNNPAPSALPDRYQGNRHLDDNAVDYIKL